ncbi:MAG: hypothetical protein HY286_10145 [Planctomycetes bacterium]|nr:hypothetical protein [Planctomycetota bacterium]
MRAPPDFFKILELEGNSNFGILEFLGESGYIFLRRHDLENNYENAKTIFRALIHIAPRSAVGYLGAAEASLGLNDYVSARRFADLARRARNVVNGEIALAYLLHGRASLGMEKPEDACAAFRQAVDVDPSGPEARTSAELLRRFDEFRAWNSPRNT